MLVSSHILEFFINRNKLSTCRLHFYVKNKYNNHLHVSNFKEIAEDLNISYAVIYKNIRQLELLGICKSYGSYIRFFSWKKWCTKKSTITKVSLVELRDLKFLRSLFYNLKYRSAWRVARKNHIKQPVLIKKQKSSGYYDVSASFVKKVNSLEVSLKTLLTHLNRGTKYKLNEVKKVKKVLLSSPQLEDCLLMRKYLDLTDTTSIKKVNNLFTLFTYLPNKCRFSF